MASNTPNLNLLKKDPVTDGNETFNIQTMLNDNWDKIDEAIGDVREELQDINIPPASLTEAGIVRLSNSTSGTREDVAATEKAVKMTYDAAVAAQTTANAANLAAASAQTKADQAFQLGNERKSEVVAALVAKGISASTSESWDTLITKLNSIVKATGNASAAQLLQGYTASNASGPIAGSMINRSAQNHHQPAADTAIYPGDRIFLAPPEGYYSGSSWVATPAPNLKPENILEGISILGILGTLQRGKRYASGNISVSNQRINVTGLSFAPRVYIFKVDFTNGDKALGLGFHSSVIGEGFALISGYTSNGFTSAFHSFNADGFTSTTYYSAPGTATWYVIE